MQLIFTPIIKPKLNTCCFSVTFKYEHGDADSSESYTTHISLNKEEFVGYVGKVDEIAAMIANSRSTGESLPDDFDEQAKYAGVSIPLEFDLYAKQYMSGYYAAMEIDSIKYVDEHGIQFDVVVNRTMSK